MKNTTVAIVTLMLLVNYGSHLKANPIVAQQVQAASLGIPPHGQALQWYARQAKQKGYKVVLLPKGIGNPAGSFVDLNTALHNYDVVVADLASKAVVVSDDFILTWFRFTIVKTLYRAPSLPSFPNAQRPPQVLGPVESNSFAIVEPGGSTRIEGVVLREPVPFDEEFQPGRRYVLFVNRGPDGVAMVLGQWQGIFMISDDTLKPRDKGASPLAVDIASKFNNSLNGFTTYLSKVQKQ